MVRVHRRVRPLLLLAVAPAALAAPSWTVMPGFNDVTSMLMTDLDGDGTAEVLVGSYGFLGLGARIEAYRHDGTPWWSFGVPELVGFRDVATGDVDGDGRPEVVFGTERFDAPAGLYVLEHDGTLVAGWPKPGGIFWDTPTLVDLDGDATLDVVTGWRDDLSVPHLFGYAGDGTQLWQVTGPHDTPTHTAAGDLDGDGSPELVTAFNVFAGIWDSELKVTRADGSDFGLTIAFADERVVDSPVLGDVDADGDLEIVVATAVRVPDAGYVYVFDPASGSTLPGWPQLTGNQRLETAPTLADVDGDRDLEIFIDATDGNLFGWQHDGTLLPGWPVANPASPSPWTLAPVAGDVDEDGVPELLFNGLQCHVTVVDPSGAVQLSTAVYDGPLQCAVHAITLGNLGVDRDLSIAIGTGEEIDQAILRSIRPNFDPTTMEWPTAYHDRRRTANYHTRD